MVRRAGLLLPFFVEYSPDRVKNNQVVCLIFSPKLNNICVRMSWHIVVDTTWILGNYDFSRKESETRRATNHIGKGALIHEQQLTRSR